MKNCNPGINDKSSSEFNVNHRVLTTSHRVHRKDNEFND